MKDELTLWHPVLVYWVTVVVGVPLHPLCVVSHAFQVAKGAVRASSFGAEEIPRAGKVRGFPIATLGRSREVMRREKDPILENMIWFM